MIRAGCNSSFYTTESPKRDGTKNISVHLCRLLNVQLLDFFYWQLAVVAMVTVRVHFNYALCMWHSVGKLWAKCDVGTGRLFLLVIIFPKHSARTEYGPRNRILRDRRTDNTMYFVFDYIFSVLFESSIMPNSLANCKPLQNCGSQIQRIKRDCNEKKKPTCQPGTTVGSNCYLFMKYGIVVVMEMPTHRSIVGNWAVVFEWWVHAVLCCLLVLWYLCFATFSNGSTLHRVSSPDFHTAIHLFLGRSWMRVICTKTPHSYIWLLSQRTLLSFPGDGCYVKNARFHCSWKESNFTE